MHSNVDQLDVKNKFAKVFSRDYGDSKKCKKKQMYKEIFSTLAKITFSEKEYLDEH